MNTHEREELPELIRAELKSARDIDDGVSRIVDLFGRVCRAGREGVGALPEIPIGHSADEWGGRDTGPWLHTTDEVCDYVMRAVRQVAGEPNADTVRLDWLIEKPLMMLFQVEGGYCRVENYGNGKAMSGDFRTPREAIDDAIRRLSPQSGGSDE